MLSTISSSMSIPPHPVIPTPWQSSTQNAKSKMLTSGRRSRENQELFSPINAVCLSNIETNKLAYLLRKFLANI